MAVGETLLATFNRGVISPKVLARVDLNRTRLSAETQTNWMPLSLGAMSIRPGLKYTTSTRSDAKAQYIPFVYARDDTALIEITASSLRVLVDEAPVSRMAVSTAISNGTFDSDLTDWTDADEAAAASTWLTGGYMKLVGARFNSAIRRQQVTVAGPDQGVRHALRIVIARGPVILRVGSTSGDDDYITETTLGTGTHSLAFTPTGNFWVEFANRNQRSALVDSVAVEGEGDMVLPVPYALADLPLLRWDQSNDVVFLACEDHQQRRIERRASDSWSIILYEPIDGPFRVQNTGSVQISASALNGDVTLTATGPLFRSGHVGALFRVRSAGQRVELSANGENQFSNPIRVTGVGNSRRFFWEITGTWSGTITIQQSLAEPGAWNDYRTISANESEDHTDEQDNQIIYYRIGIKSGDYVSGTADLVLRFPGGSIVGVVRINSVASKTSAVAGVIEDLGNTDATQVWNEGSWSDYRGWPSAVAFYEGRLGWFGKAGVWQSISDTVDAFNPDTTGDSGPINRTIRYGSADSVCWAQAAQRLLIGTVGAELSIRSTSFDEPLTPNNFNIKPASTQGALRTVPAVLMDGSVAFVQSGGVRVYELRLAGSGGLDYTPIDLTTLAPEITGDGIVAMAVQRQPETRIHCVRDDGKVAVAIIDRAEDVLAWVLLETDGVVEGVVRLPGEIEDQVYYVVRRTINGQTKRYLERLARQSDCVPGDVVHLLDSHRIFTGADTSNLGGLLHLEGEEVTVWADGAHRGSYTVSGGQITVVDGNCDPLTVQNACVGLPYTASYKSAKLGTLFDRKRVTALGLMARDLHHDAVRYGDGEGDLFPLPRIEQGKPVGSNKSWTSYQEDKLPVNPGWSVDSTVRLEAQSPYPATILALVPTVEGNARA